MRHQHLGQKRSRKREWRNKTERKNESQRDERWRQESRRGLRRAKARYEVNRRCPELTPHPSRQYVNRGGSTGQRRPTSRSVPSPTQGTSALPQPCLQAPIMHPADANPPPACLTAMLHPCNPFIRPRNPFACVPPQWEHPATLYSLPPHTSVALPLPTRQLHPSIPCTQVRPRLTQSPSQLPNAVCPSPPRLRYLPSAPPPLSYMPHATCPRSVRTHAILGEVCVAVIVVVIHACPADSHVKGSIHQYTQ